MWILFGGGNDKGHNIKLFKIIHVVDKAVREVCFLKILDVEST